MKQKQKAGARVTQMKNIPKRIDSNLLDQYKHDDYNTNKS